MHSLTLFNIISKHRVHPKERARTTFQLRRFLISGFAGDLILWIKSGGVIGATSDFQRAELLHVSAHVSFYSFLLFSMRLPHTDINILRETKVYLQLELILETVQTVAG